jgi:acetyl esterase/lipase
VSNKQSEWLPTKDGTGALVVSVRAIATAWMLRHFVKPRMAGATLEEGRRSFESMALRTKVPKGTVVNAVRIGELEGERLTSQGVDEGRALLWFFGGGYQVGSPLTTRALAIRIAAAARVLAFVPAYRRCPEHPLTASLEDALVAYRWLQGELGSADGIVVGGESAGGGLALRLVGALRDAGDSLPAAVVVISPWTDLAMTGASIKSNARSDALFSPAFLEQTSAGLVGVTDPRDPRFSPLYADLSGFPPLLVHVSGHEVLRDDSVRLAERARSAGVDVTLRVFPGLWHVFHASTDLPEARKAVSEIADFARDRLARRESRIARPE